MAINLLQPRGITLFLTGKMGSKARLLCFPARKGSLQPAFQEAFANLVRGKRAQNLKWRKKGVAISVIQTRESV
ncbi:hypothetical protein QM201_00360 [Enterobacter asburiae]|nr:hypothetical protein [Enterobacter asburiae]